MKKVSLYLTVIILALVFTGCGSPKFLNGLSSEGKDFNSAINRDIDNNNIKIMTTVEKDIKKRLPIIVKAAAKEFKKQNVEYFSLSSTIQNGPFLLKSGMNRYITNAKDMLDYCFPSSFGLEVKCEKLETAHKAFLIFTPEEKSFDRPQWSVKEVLEDNFYNIETEELIFKELDLKELSKAYK